MQKYLAGIIILCFVACGSIAMQKSSTVTQSNNDNKILWSSTKKLTWDDFKGIPPSDKDDRLAETFGEIKTVKSYWENGVPKFEIHCYFLKNKSWTSTDSSLTLEHEQIHFDIFEVYARKIRKSFDSLNIEKNIDFDLYEAVFNKYLTENERTNVKYDNDVRFDRLKQQEWITKIGKELEALKDYEYNPDE